MVSTGCPQAVWGTAAPGPRPAATLPPVPALAVWPAAPSFRLVETLQRLCAFAAALERLLVMPDAAAFEAMWEELGLDQLGWEALALARRGDTEPLEPVLGQLDRRLLALL